MKNISFLLLSLFLIYSCSETPIEKIKDDYDEDELTAFRFLAFQNNNIYKKFTNKTINFCFVELELKKRTDNSINIIYNANSSENARHNKIIENIEDYFNDLLPEKKLKFSTKNPQIKICLLKQNHFDFIKLNLNQKYKQLKFCHFTESKNLRTSFLNINKQLLKNLNFEETLKSGIYDCLTGFGDFTLIKNSVNNVLAKNDNKSHEISNFDENLLKLCYEEGISNKMPLTLFDSIFNEEISEYKEDNFEDQFKTISNKQFTILEKAIYNNSEYLLKLPKTIKLKIENINLLKEFERKFILDFIDNINSNTDNVEIKMVNNKPNILLNLTNDESSNLTINKTNFFKNQTIKINNLNFTKIGFYYCLINAMGLYNSGFEHFKLVHKILEKNEKFEDVISQARMFSLDYKYLDFMYNPNLQNYLKNSEFNYLFIN
jgi:hypothetical protein